MEPNEIETFRIFPKVTKIETGIRYVYTEKAGWFWLQKICFSILGWLRAYEMSFDKVTTWRRTPHDNADVLRRIMQQEQVMAQLHYKREDLKIYMGPDDFDELIHMSERGLHVFTIHAKTKTGSQENDGPVYVYHNIPITVIHYMKGILIVPANT